MNCEVDGAVRWINRLTSEIRSVRTHPGRGYGRSNLRQIPHGHLEVTSSQ